MHHLLSLSALALAASTASAYLNTSPFFLLTTSKDDVLLNGERPSKITTAAAITSHLSQTVVPRCSSDYYILVSQPGITSEGWNRYYRSRWASSGVFSRRLDNAAEHKPATTSSSSNTLSIPEVIGEIDIEALAKQLSSSCQIPHVQVDATRSSIPSSYDHPRSVATVQLRAPAAFDAHQWEDDLTVNDAVLEALLDVIPTSNYTVIYTTSPHGKGKHLGEPPAPIEEQEQYEMMDSADIPEPLHLDLKRAVGPVGEHAPGALASHVPKLVDGPLFHRYQFFTPGIFSGFLVGFLLLLILYVAISGLASLQVTYAAFDKEQGQLAPKKLQ